MPQSAVSLVSYSMRGSGLPNFVSGLFKRFRINWVGLIYKKKFPGPQTLNPVFRSRDRSPDLGNVNLKLFEPIRTDLAQVSAQTVGPGPETYQIS